MKSVVNKELDNETKISKLYQFLELALNEASQAFFQIKQFFLIKGINIKLTKIINELCNKEKSTQLLSLWMVALNKKLTNTKSQFESNELQNIILNQVPWFDSENHIQLFKFYEKFLLHIVSSKNNKSSIQQTFQELLKKLVPIKQIEQDQKANEQLKINDKTFTNKQELIQFIQKILQLKNDGLPYLTPISRSHQDFLIQLFKYHPKSSKKLNKIKEIKIGQIQKFGKKSICFYLIFSDNKIEDISYLKCIDALVEKNRNISALQPIEGWRLDVSMKILDLLKKIITIYPLQKLVLIKTIKQAFPAKNSELRILNQFLIQILKFAHLNENLKYQILDIIFEKLIEIDCEIKFNKYEAKEGEIYNEDYIDEMALKLDWLLFILFEYVNYEFRPDLPNDIFGVNSQISPSKKTKDKCLFEYLMNIFETKLLVTFQPKYVQFIFFYLCQIQQNSTKFGEKFLTILLNNYKVQKQISENALYYFCSFLVRAKYLDKQIIEESIQYLIKYLDEYCFCGINKEKSDSSQEIKEIVNKNYLPFLSLQGLFYIICYKYAIISENSTLSNDITRIVEKISKFVNISLILEPSIKEQIIQLTKKNKLPFLFLSNLEDASPQNSTLKMYFPFDPYLLKNSEQFINLIYINWSDSFDKKTGQNNCKQFEKKNNEETTVSSALESDSENVNFKKTEIGEGEQVKRSWKEYQKGNKKIKEFQKKIELIKKKKFISN